MKRQSLLLLSMLSCVVTLAQNTVETIYYDANRKGVSDEAFATYKAIFAIPEDSNYEKQVIVKYLPNGQNLIEGTYYYFDKYDYDKNKFKEYKSYGTKGTLLSEIKGDSISYTTTTYWPSGKKQLSFSTINKQVEGESLYFDEEEDIMSISHYKNGKQQTPLECYYRGVHTKYLVDDNGDRGHIILDKVSIDERTFEKDSKGVNWQKYSKNGLIIQASCVKGNEYGKYWTLQFIISNYALDWVDIKYDSLIVYGSKNSQRVEMTKIPSKDYMKKVKRKHSNRQFWQSFAEAFVTADAGKTTSTTRVNVRNRNYRVETTYYDQYARREAQQKSQERLDAYSKSLMEEREELADNYFRTQAVNPGNSVLCVQCLKLIDVDETYAELYISGIKYVFRWNCKI